MLEIDKFSEKRKKLLQRMNQGENLSVLELGMYDLTPYYKNKFDVSLSEAILLNQNLEREIRHVNQNIYFSPPQQEALEILLRESKVILSAPTSFGKTLIVKEYIYREQPSNVVYIVPTNALAYELEKTFKENKEFNNYDIFDKVETALDSEFYKSRKKALFIGTQEKFLELGLHVFNKIDLFVIDEAYKLQESIGKQRGFKLSKTFLESINRKSKQIILLSPQARFVGFEEYDFFTYSSNFNAVDKNFIVLDKDEFYECLLENGQNQKSILFCQSPSQINSVYEELECELFDTERLLNFSNQLSEDIHPEWSVVKLLKKGILTHHGQMPKYVQNKMINLYNSDDLSNLLIGTNSISEGINTSTKNLMIHPNYTRINSNELLIKNTIGRAGRLGKYPIGYVYSVKPIEELMNKEIVIELSVSKEEELLELEETHNDEKIQEVATMFNLNLEFCKVLIDKYNISLNKLIHILKALRKPYKYEAISNLPYIAHCAFEKEYGADLKYDAILIKAYLQSYYMAPQKKWLTTFDDKIEYFNYENKKQIARQNKKKNKQKLYKEKKPSDVINLYMQFTYSTFEYYILPVVNIGLDIYENNNCWEFGENVLKSLQSVKDKYNGKIFGELSHENLSESHIKIINTLKDYGMLNELKNFTITTLDEIEEKLNIRYSTIDIINVIKYLSMTETNNKGFYQKIVNKYIN